MTSEDTYSKLKAPFDKTHQKNGLDYVTGEQVTGRLNDVLGWDGWSFRVVSHGYDSDADELWALGELTTWSERGVQTRQQFGSQKHNRKRDTKEVLDMGFDLKGAATDALKKCASLIGVGLYLHEKDGGQTAPQRPTQAKPPKPMYVEYLIGLGFTADEVIKCSHDLYDNNDPNTLNLEQKRRVQLALEQRKNAEMKEKVPA